MADPSITGPEMSEPPVVHTVGLDIPNYYANVGNVTVTLFDVLFVFGVRDEEGRITETHKLRMSKEQAWVLAKVLDRLLLMHFARSGTLPAFPEEFLDGLELVERYQADAARVCAMDADTTDTEGDADGA